MESTIKTVAKHNDLQNLQLCNVYVFKLQLAINCTDKVSLQPKLEELSPNYDVSTTKSDTYPDPPKAQIQEIKPIDPNVILLFHIFLY